MPRNYQIAKGHILQAMPGTVAQLVKKSGYETVTVQRWVARLRAGEPHERACHISGYQEPEGYGYAPPIYTRGPGEHAEYTHTPLTPSEKWSRAKAKHGMDALRKKERHRDFKRKLMLGQVELDPLQALLCGRTITGP